MFPPSNPKSVKDRKTFPFSSTGPEDVSEEDVSGTFVTVPSSPPSSVTDSATQDRGNTSYVEDTDETFVCRADFAEILVRRDATWKDTFAGGKREKLPQSETGRGRGTGTWDVAAKGKPCRLRHQLRRRVSWVLLFSPYLLR